MKKHPLVLSILICVFIFSGFDLWVEAQEDASNFGVYVRRNAEQKRFGDDFKLGTGDLSYGIGGEYHEGPAFWQLGVDFSPRSSLVESLDYAIRPQLNLMYGEQHVVAGVGVFTSYYQDSELGDSWSDPYGQILLGFELPLPLVSVQLCAIHIFHNPSQITRIDTDNLEYVLWLRLPASKVSRFIR